MNAQTRLKILADQLRHSKHRGLSHGNPFISFGAFNPLSIAGCKLWLDSSDLTTITKDGGNLVSQWNDKSGEGNHVTQATGTNQPLWVDAVRNGKAIIRFDGVDNYMQKTTFAGGSLQPKTIFIVTTTPADSGIARYLFDGGGAATRTAIYSDDTNMNMSTDFASTLSYAKPVDGTWKYWTGKYNGASSDFRENATSKATGATGATAMDGITLATRYNFTTSFANIDIAEILIYDTSLSAGDITSIESYLASKWGF